MLIECPFCRAQAQLSEELEGSKVRCAKCRKVFVGQPPGSQAKKQRKALTLIMISTGVLAAIVAVAFLLRQGEPAKGAPAAAKNLEPEAAPSAPDRSFDSEPVRAVRQIYDAAYARDEAHVIRLLSGAHLAQARRDPADTAWVPFAERPLLERERFLASVASELTTKDGDDAPERWQPTGGEVLEQKRDEALVRIDLAPRDTQSAFSPRKFQWKLALEDGRWRVWGWERWLSPEERAASPRTAAAAFGKQVLADGSQMLMAEPGPLEHLATTSPELRAEIDAMLLEMIDFTLPPADNNVAHLRLVEIGKPALPVLLTGLYRIEAVDDTALSKLNLIDQALRSITGNSTGFVTMQPGVDGEKRREQAIRGWFGWWRAFGGKFERAPAGDEFLEELEREQEARKAQRKASSGN